MPAKVSRTQLKRRKAMNVARGLIEQGYKLNWPRASKFSQMVYIDKTLRPTAARRTTRRASNG